ncbi:MAG: hypothetical protein A2017_02470 [Lentisphaerae bacterium GWF2_44_16]|nr:MAG: hypothetical protein A2017_02470 [Lentisphaerae bacterium GWF2_44_16]
MSGYSNSEITRMALIMAAGKLFAEHGIDGVTTRAIAEKAGENIGVIHYHFGGKDGLINAVMDFVCEPWSGDPLGTFLEAHRYLLKTRNGQNGVLVNMIKIFFSIFFSSERPSWCTTLGFQIIQRDLEVSRNAFKLAAVPNIKAFMELYYVVSGDRDFERAYNWSMTVTAPALLISINPLAIKRMHPDGAPSDKFISKLKFSCIHNALLTIQFLSRKGKKIKSEKIRTEQ